MNPTNEVSASSTATVPSTWPGAFGVYQYSRDAVRRNFWLLVEVIAVLTGVTILASIFNAQGTVTGKLVYYLLSLVNVVFYVMMAQIYIASVRGKKLSNNDLFSNNLPMLTLKYLGMSLVVGLISIVSFLLFIIPAFFIVPRFSLAAYFLVDKNMDVFEAISASWQATKGNVGKVYGIVGVSILFTLICVTVIGIPFALYLLIMYGAATVVLYEYLLRKHNA